MDEDWRNAFGILMCKEICDGAGAGIWDGSPSTCSSVWLFLHFAGKKKNKKKADLITLRKKFTGRQLQTKYIFYAWPDDDELLFYILYKS